MNSYHALYDLRVVLADIEGTALEQGVVNLLFNKLKEEALDYSSHDGRPPLMRAGTLSQESIDLTAVMGAYHRWRTVYLGNRIYEWRNPPIWGPVWPDSMSARAGE